MKSVDVGKLHTLRYGGDIHVIGEGEPGKPTLLRHEHDLNRGVLPIGRMCCMDVEVEHDRINPTITDADKANECTRLRRLR
jgi:hypothetical protein